MPLFKKKITEQEAASHFIRSIMNEASSAWPSILEELKDTFQEQFVLEDEKIANLDLGLFKKTKKPISKNNTPLIIPCHRVIRSDGKLGNYSAPGGIVQKQKYLDLERES